MVAALLRAIGDRLTCVFVDTALLRLHEGDQVMQVFARNLGVKVIRVDADARFLDALAGVADPEAKRKIIGRLFIEVKSVGVTGDGRRHEPVVAPARGRDRRLRDRPLGAPLDVCSRHILNEVPGDSRVVYDTSGRNILVIAPATA